MKGWISVSAMMPDDVACYNSLLRDTAFPESIDFRMPNLPRLTEMAHMLAANWLRPGDLAIDATAGNGHDTAFLARLACESGTVLAVDVEPAALEATARRLADEGVPPDHVRLVQGDHARLEQLTPPEWFGRVRVIMFNLGYRPHSNWPIQTRLVSTLSALGQSLALLGDGGLLTIVMYPGHAGGEAETQAILEWATGLDDTLWHVARYDLPNIRSRPPILLAIHKRHRKDFVEPDRHSTGVLARIVRTR